MSWLWVDWAEGGSSCFNLRNVQRVDFREGETVIYLGIPYPPLRVDERDTAPAVMRSRLIAALKASRG